MTTNITGMLVNYMPAMEGPWSDTPDHETFHQFLVEIAEAAFAAQGGVNFNWIVLYPSGRMEAMEFAGEVPKHVMITAMRDWMRRRGAIAYAFTSEAWTLQVERKPGEQPSLPEGSLEHVPGRIEILQVMSYDKDGVGKSTMWTIERDSDEPRLASRVRRKEVYRIGPNTSVGTFCDLLEPVPAREAQS